MLPIRAFSLITALLACASCPLAAETPDLSSPAAKEILPLLEKNADAQLAEMKGKTPTDWTAATFYVGLARLTHISKNPAYTEALQHIADANKWDVNRS